MQRSSVRPTSPVGGSDNANREAHAHWMKLLRALDMIFMGRANLGSGGAHLAAGHVQVLLHEAAQLHGTTGMMSTSAISALVMLFA